MAILMMGGIAAWWSFGREFVDGDALPALLGIATPRSSVAVAEFVVLAGWALLTVVSTVILTSDRRPAPRTDMDAAAVQAAPRVTVAGLLGARGVGRTDGAGLQLVPRFICQDSSPCWALVVVAQINTAIGARAGSPAPRTARGSPAATTPSRLAGWPKPSHWLAATGPWY